MFSCHPKWDRLPNPNKNRGHNFTWSTFACCQLDRAPFYFFSLPKRREKYKIIRFFFLALHLCKGLRKSNQLTISHYRYEIINSDCHGLVNFDWTQSDFHLLFRAFQQILRVSHLSQTTPLGLCHDCIIYTLKKKEEASRDLYCRCIFAMQKKLAKIIVFLFAEQNIYRNDAFFFTKNTTLFLHTFCSKLLCFLFCRLHRLFGQITEEIYHEELEEKTRFINHKIFPHYLSEQWRKHKGYRRRLNSWSPTVELVHWDFPKEAQTS